MFIVSVPDSVDNSTVNPVNRVAFDCSTLTLFSFFHSFEPHESKAWWWNIKIQKVLRKHTESQAHLEVTLTMAEAKFVQMQKLYIIYRFICIDFFPFIFQVNFIYTAQCHKYASIYNMYIRRQPLSLHPHLCGFIFSLEFYVSHIYHIRHISTLIKTITYSGMFACQHSV